MVAGTGSKGGAEGIADRLEDHAIVACNRLSQDRVVTRESGLHRVPVLFPAGGRALDVGKQEGEGAGGQVSHSCGTPGVVAWAWSCGASRTGRAAGWLTWLPYASVLSDPLLSLPVGITLALVCTCSHQCRSMHPLPAGHGRSCTCG